jgi:hypothetical protein
VVNLTIFLVIDAQTYKEFACQAEPCAHSLPGSKIWSNASREMWWYHHTNWNGSSSQIQATQLVLIAIGCSHICDFQGECFASLHLYWHHSYIIEPFVLEFLTISYTWDCKWAWNWTWTLAKGVSASRHPPPQTLPKPAVGWNIFYQFFHLRVHVHPLSLIWSDLDIG